MHASIAYSFVNGNQDGIFRIDSSTGQVYSAASLVGKTGIRFEISVSASDNQGTQPFNTVANLTTARVMQLNTNTVFL